MSKNWVLEKAIKLIDNYTFSNPYELIWDLGIDLQWHELGSNIMGYTTEIKRVPTIVLNNNMTDKMAIPVAYHELGHYQCHKGVNTNFFTRNSLERMGQGYESEANLFMFKMMFRNHDSISRANQEKILDYYGIPHWMATYFDKI